MKRRIRRIRRIRRALKRAGLYNAFHITLIAVLLTGFCVILFNVKEPEQQEEKPETTQAEVMQNPETMTQTAESIEDKYKVFDTMSEDWGSDDLEGFVFYDLPEKYADKGYFPEKMQIYTRCLCKQNDVPYALVLAIIAIDEPHSCLTVSNRIQPSPCLRSIRGNVVMPSILFHASAVA